MAILMVYMVTIYGKQISYHRYREPLAYFSVHFSKQIPENGSTTLYQNHGVDQPISMGTLEFPWDDITPAFLGYCQY